MGASRMGYNLWRKHGWKHLWLRRRHVNWRLVLGDTFLPLICRVLGHVIYDAADPWDKQRGKHEWACARCHTFQPKYDPGE